MKKTISVLAILLGIILFFFGLELLGIIIAVVGLFLFPNARSANNTENPYYDEYLFDQRDDSPKNETSDSRSDDGGGKDD